MGDHDICPSCGGASLETARPGCATPDWSHDPRAGAPRYAVEALDRVRIAWRPHYQVVLSLDDLGWYFQIEVQRPDIGTGEPGVGRGGKGYVNDDMTLSGMCRTIFGLFKAYDLHEVHEAFQLDGVSIYGPHIDVEALLEVGNRFDWTQEAERG